MVDLIETAQRFEDLMNKGSHDMPYVFDNFFSVESRGEKSASKKKFQLLKEVNKLVSNMLETDEKVHFITPAVLSSGGEMFFVGAIWLQYINRRALIFTNKRILILQIDSKNKPRPIKSQIKYSAIKNIKGSFGSLKIKLHKGKALAFTGIYKKDLNLIQNTVENFLKVAPPAQLEAVGKENLCPYCYTPVEGIPESCPKCFKRFKSPGKALKLSLLFPGLGNIYLGNRALGIFELIAGIMIWLVFLVPTAEESYEAGEIIITIVLVYVLMHGIDAIGTWLMAKKGIRPAD